MILKTRYDWVTTSDSVYLSPTNNTDYYIASVHGNRWVIYITLWYGSLKLAWGSCTSIEDGKKQVEEEFKRRGFYE